MSPPAPGRLGLDVLIVDDDALVRKSYGNQLRAEGCTVVVAADGQEALQIENTKFDVILLDVRTPNCSGPDILRALRGRPESADAVFFLLAQPGDEDLVDRAMREGADGVFEKMRMSPRDVASAIRKFYEAGGHATRAGANPAIAAAAPDAAAPARSENVPSAVDDIARRFRSTGSHRLDSEARTTRVGATTTQARDPTAAARAVAARVTRREMDERDRGPPLSSRWTSKMGDENRATGSAALPTAQTESLDGYNTVINRFVGDGAKLAEALGLPADFTCPTCGQQIALRLWPEPARKGRVRGRFYCSRCEAG
jgi:CheY-like chemotaxis protein